MQHTVDVVIIGAGPAGPGAGIVFAQNGLRTVVCDQRRLPLINLVEKGSCRPGWPISNDSTLDNI